MIVNEINLLLACEQGNVSGQRLVFEKYAGKILAVCQRYFNDKQAEEILHNTFLVAFKKLKNNKNTDLDILSFLKGLAIDNILSKISTLKFSSYEEEVGEITFNDQADFKLGVDTKRLLEIIQGLDTTKRFVFNLYVIEGFSFENISNLLNMKEEDINRIYKLAKQEVMEKTVDVLA